MPFSPPIFLLSVSHPVVIYSFGLSPVFFIPSWQPSPFRRSVPHSHPFHLIIPYMSFCSSVFSNSSVSSLLIYSMSSPPQYFAPLPHKVHFTSLFFLLFSSPMLLAPEIKLLIHPCIHPYFHSSSSILFLSPWYALPSSHFPDFFFPTPFWWCFSILCGFHLKMIMLYPFRSAFLNLLSLNSMLYWTQMLTFTQSHLGRG